MNSLHNNDNLSPFTVNTPDQLRKTAEKKPVLLNKEISQGDEVRKDGGEPNDKNTL